MDPEHPSTPPAVERVPDLAALTSVEAELADVERALTRLDEGSYGTCEVCGAALGDVRLASEPAAARCDEHRAAPLS